LRSFGWRDRFAEFTKLIGHEALPLLRKQKGFQDEITVVAPGGADTVAISLWHLKENADAYSRDAYPGLLKVLGRLLRELLGFTPSSAW
jgi:hypothetical protein